MVSRTSSYVDSDSEGSEDDDDEDDNDGMGSKPKNIYHADVNILHLNTQPMV